MARCFDGSKVWGWYDCGTLNVWVWPCLGGGITSLKFMQFKSAVCDALEVFHLGVGLYGV